LCPGVVVTCVDTVGKKAAFIRQVSAELGLLQQLRAEHARVEQLKGQFDVITSRAFASLNDFTDWTAQLMGPGSHWMAMKGKAPADELALLPATVEVLRVDPLLPGVDAAQGLKAVAFRPSARQGRAVDEGCCWTACVSLVLNRVCCPALHCG